MFTGACRDRKKKKNRDICPYFLLNMEPARLKRELGNRLVFWGGGCDTQQILATATPEEIRQHVKGRLGIFAPGGGYVFNQIHNIQADVSAENVIAMFDAACEYGCYP